MHRILLMVSIVSFGISTFAQQRVAPINYAHKSIPFGQIIAVNEHIYLLDSLQEYIITHRMNATDSMSTVFRLGYYLVRNLTCNSTLYWQKEVVNDGDNNWSVPFILKPSLIIIYNGTPLLPGQWDGDGSTTLTVNLNIRKYDHLILIN